MHAYFKECILFVSVLTENLFSPIVIKEKGVFLHLGTVLGRIVMTFRFNPHNIPISLNFKTEETKI